MKRVLVLGAGLVARPMVEYLLGHEDINLTVADAEPQRAQEMVKDHPRGTATALRVDNVDSGLEALGRLYTADEPEQSALAQLITDHDLTISLLPFTFHVTVAKLCVRFHKPMVTASYVSSEMKELDRAAKSAGIILLNEIGVDPGLDHMSAKRVIDDVQERGGRVITFSSYCGGLPAPEANTNPWGYKFSWSPQGVVMAGKNAGRFLRDGEIIEIKGENLFSHFDTISVPGIGEFEGYTNRDCLGYIDLYNLHGIKSMFRGTIRYPGWCKTMQQVLSLGYLDNTHRRDLAGKTYGDLARMLIGNENAPNIKEAVADHLGINVDSEPIERLDWLGLFGDEQLPAATSIMDILVERLDHKLPYAPGERDMLVMHHEFVAEFENHKEFLTSSLIDYGIPNGDSSMARTVSLPAAIAVRLILDGKIDEPGVQIPVTPEFYNPILDELDEMDISFVEQKETLDDRSGSF